MHVGDHKLETRVDFDEEIRSIRVRFGRWRPLPVHVAKVLVPAPVGVQHDTIERGQDLDVRLVGCHVTAADLEAAIVVGLAVLVVQALAAYERGVKGLVNRQAHCVFVCRALLRRVESHTQLACAAGA